MNFEIVTIVSLVVFMIVRELMHYFQVTKLQELLKAVDITEYRNSQKKEVVKSPSENVVMEKNDIFTESDEFDIRKVSEVVVDGIKKPINIIK